MGSEFPFDEMLLGPRYILLGKQHALFDSPKLHLLGYSIVRLPLAGNRVLSDTVNTSSRTRPVIHYVDKLSRTFSSSPKTGGYIMSFWISFAPVFIFLLLSPYLCFISLLYLDLYVLGDDALIN